MQPLSFFEQRPTAAADLNHLGILSNDAMLSFRECACASAAEYTMHYLPGASESQYSGDIVVCLATVSTLRSSGAAFKLLFAVAVVSRSKYKKG